MIIIEFSDLAPDVRQKLASLVLYYYGDSVTDDMDLVEGHMVRKVIETTVREQYDAVLYNKESQLCSYDQRWARRVAYRSY